MCRVEIEIKNEIESTDLRENVLAGKRSVGNTLGRKVAVTKCNEYPKRCEEKRKEMLSSLGNNSNGFSSNTCERPFRLILMISVKWPDSNTERNAKLGP